MPCPEQLQKQASYTFAPQCSSFEPRETSPLQGLHRTQSAFIPTEVKNNDNCQQQQDFIINHQLNPIAAGENQYQIPRRPQNPFQMNQGRMMRCHNRSRSKSRGRRYATQNFFNQTMTQIVQGKNRELQPLVDRRRLAQQPPSFAALYPP